MTFKLSVWIEGFIKADKESPILPFLKHLFHSGGSESINATGRQHAESFRLYLSASVEAIGKRFWERPICNISRDSLPSFFF